MLLCIIILLSVTTPHSITFFASPTPAYMSAINNEVTKAKSEI